MGVDVRTTVTTGTAAATRRPRPGLARHAPALSVLEGASAVLHRGWLQHAAREVRAPDGRLTAHGRGDLVRSCLVAAVLEAAHWQDDDPSTAGPALDALWLTLHERPGARDGAVGPVPSPGVRELRARDLARWNDAPERTQAEVLALLDRAARRVRAELDPSVREPAVC
jgi:hypothetical protein